MNTCIRNVCNAWWIKITFCLELGNNRNLSSNYISWVMLCLFSLCEMGVSTLLFVSNGSFCFVILFLFLAMQWVVMEEARELVSCMPMSLLTLHFSSMCFLLWLGGKLKVSLGEVLVSSLQQKMGTDEIKLNNTKNWVIYNWNCNNKQNLLFLVEKKFTKNGK